MGMAYAYNPNQDQEIKDKERSFRIQELLQIMLGGEELIESMVLDKRDRCEDCHFPLVTYRITTIGGQLRHSTNLCFCDDKADACKVMAAWPYFIGEIDEEEREESNKARKELEELLS